MTRLPKTRHGKEAKLWRLEGGGLGSAVPAKASPQNVPFFASRPVNHGHLNSMLSSRPGLQTGPRPLPHFPRFPLLQRTFPSSRAPSSPPDSSQQSSLPPFSSSSPPFLPTPSTSDPGANLQGPRPLSPGLEARSGALRTAQDAAWLLRTRGLAAAEATAAA